MSTNTSTQKLPMTDSETEAWLDSCTFNPEQLLTPEQRMERESANAWSDKIAAEKARKNEKYMEEIRRLQNKPWNRAK